MSEAATTDLYEVTMAMSYMEHGLTGPATFGLFPRRLPPDRGFLVAAGLEPALDYLERFRVGPEDVAAFAEALHRPLANLAPLLGTRFTGEVRAVPEGRVVLAGEPLLEVTAPLPQAQLVESVLLNQLNHHTMVASKAARCVLAADGRRVVDFSLRRTQGLEAAMAAARLGALAGFAATSNVAAATAYGLPATGTMAHSYIEAFGNEEAAFRSFALTHPGPVTFLVDTYDTEAGTEVAAKVFREMGLGEGCAIRLDSGDLGELAHRSRRILDRAGLPEVRIVASGGLDEYAVDDLVRAGAPIDVFAVGTKVGVAADAPYLDTAYKLVSYAGRPVMKLSTAKVTAPGPKAVWRRPGGPDLIATRDEPPPAGAEPLLRTVMTDGRRTGPRDTLRAAHERLTADLAALPRDALRVRGPKMPVPVVSDRLVGLTDEVRKRIERDRPSAPAARPHVP
ncbi:nicotinate phosphoribosyltransferase [Streptomyces sp. 8K308]|uniref:nicotinate phosphoribosyltransferase n=1 Tax=Streptomyces sp. 8K308 TaxID=2530388 RepID=UPI00105360C2|nr:nicotinate phosphoribosyltransferase [Streptomyces sp. 8K308]TDC27442.1 nicotinate phosphoribosyltransferase [Streptomyces sp. 8K308]